MIHHSDDFSRISIQHWNKKFLKSLWYALLIASAGELVTITALNRFTWEDILHYVLLPAGINLFSLGPLTLLFRRMQAEFPYLMILAAAVICSSYIGVHSDMDHIQSLLLLPIMFSTLYYQRRMVVYACAIALASFFLMTWLHPELRARTGPNEWASMPAIILAAAWVALRVMERGVGLLRELRDEAQDKQDLMIQNVIKDKMVRTDTLTGLYNRAALFEHLDMLLRYTESEGFALHVAMLDIDHFKSVNDTFGHHIGDVVLKRVSEAIRDGIEPGDFAARYGGEEFTAVFTDRTLQDVSHTLERIRLNIATMEHPELDGRSVTLSIGLHPYSKGMSKEHLIGQADACLYQAKRTGRNKLVCD